MSVIKINKVNFQNEVKNSDKPVLLDFYADWCGPCRMVSPIVDEIAEERNDIKVGKINVDQENELAEAFGARGFYADTPETFTEVFREAYATGEPCVIDCRIDPNEFVLPMLPPGGSIDDIITEKEA